jgi:hypothetical protein
MARPPRAKAYRNPAKGDRWRLGPAEPRAAGARYRLGSEREQKMASAKDGRSGSEYDLRDDDRATPYARSGRRSGYGLILVFGLVVAGLFLGYGMFHRGEVPNQGKPEATVGSAR